MRFFESLTSAKTVLWSALILSTIIIYPNIVSFVWTFCAPLNAFSSHSQELNAPYVIYFLYRFLFFVALTWILIRQNIRQAKTKLKTKFYKSFFVTLIAYALYVLLGLSVEKIIRVDCFTQMLILQFLIAWLMPVLIGHTYYLTVAQREAEKEMEKLRTENLQSRVDALSNQINPHFFFNSLNGLTALVAAKRNEETMEYVAKLSNIFRYILQSEKKGLVKLEEELTFLNAYRYLLEVRYSGKISFKITTRDAELNWQLPVLSLLPLVENVVKHNIIDSEHKMTIYISVLDGGELSVTNPIYRKYHVEGSNGIGLSNLSARYKLLMGADIDIREDESYFTVVLPLKKSENESADC